jgi:hypothetical protein
MHDMALTASTIRPVQRLGEIEFGLVISIRPELQNASPATQKSGQEKDEEEEQQHLRNEGCRGCQYCEA